MKPVIVLAVLAVASLVAGLVRLPRFDHPRFVTAMGSTSRAGFVCGSGRPDDALLAAQPPPAEPPAQPEERRVPGREVAGSGPRL